MRYVATMDRAEATVLRGTMGQVDTMLAERDALAPTDDLSALTGIRTGPSTTPTDPVLARLLPDFHRPAEDEPTDDGGAGGVDLSPALRSVREPELVDAKRAAIAVVLATCPAGGGRIELAPTEAEGWLTAVNDVRLALGTALDVREDMPDQLPADDPRADHLPVYHWLTWLQETLVTALMG